MKKEKNVKSVNKAEKSEKGHSCLCPYCEEELAIASCPFCQACGSVISYCVSCQIMVLEVLADDKGIKEDIPNWCKTTGNECLGIEEECGVFHAYVKKTK